MTEQNIPFSSPEPTGAIFSQFYVALQKCFAMKTGESIFIEIDGDVSIIDENGENNIQIEVKEYFEPLTDSHKNFWNTLNNWITPSFNHVNYKELVIISTQNIGVNSKFLKWNDSSLSERQSILNDILTSAENRFQNKKPKKGKSKNANPPESLGLMRKVFSTSNNNDLMQVISKINIICEHPKREDITNEIIERELKGIPVENKTKVLNSLLGFVINKEDYNKGWKISCENFQKEFQDLTSQYVTGTLLFPINEEYKNLSDADKEKVNKYPFVKKIEDITYHEVITESVTAYWFTFKTISSEFSQRRSKKDSLIKFQENLKDIHKPAYRIASRNCNSSTVINKSKDFFDEIMKVDSPNFDIFNNTPIIFKNGLYHILANEEEHEIFWKLNPEE